MDASNFQPWLEKASVQPSVLVCAVKSEQSTSIVTGDPSFPEKRIKDLMQGLAEVGLTLRQDHITGGRWRWVFENAQIHSARHAEGAVALLIMTNDSNATPVADHALREFLSVAPPAPEPLVAEVPVIEEATMVEAPAEGQVLEGAAVGEVAAQVGEVAEAQPARASELQAVVLEAEPEAAAEAPIVNGVGNEDFQQN